MSDAVNLLYTDGKFHVVVDLIFLGYRGGRPFIVWIPSGHPKVDDVKKTFNNGYGPFRLAIFADVYKAHMRLKGTPEDKLFLETAGARWENMFSGV